MPVKGCFAWEYKGKKKDLDKAFAQLQQYAIALENPPLLIVSDMDRFRVHTNWTNTVQQVHEFALDDLADGATRDLLRHAFTDPERLRPAKTPQMLTEQAAEEFAKLAQRLRDRGHHAQNVAHFVNRLVFCMFAEDVRLLPDHMFTAMLKRAAWPEANVVVGNPPFLGNKKMIAELGEAYSVALRKAWPQVVVVCRDDDCTFGVLHSKAHEVWSLTLGGWHGVGNDPQYTPTLGFETFPFPEGLTPDIPAADYAADPRAKAIASAAAQLSELRENWVNPPELIERVPEVVPGYPDRILPKDEASAQVLKNRTLTNLYNARPAWLDHAHRALDEAVADAYG